MQIPKNLNVRTEAVGMPTGDIGSIFVSLLPPSLKPNTRGDVSEVLVRKGRRERGKKDKYNS
ncbi:unnamed protein product [Sphenostylis stenocarpa]|uniref:Uncharacterized protein n=1 Tax=Sphenostylis stenocarpa TaxID=92480 RepID=A0AA86VHC0_9FABA|nr:unnamed protein product [Sphenostylis stenocarpa]